MTPHEHSLRGCALAFVACLFMFGASIAAIAYAMTRTERLSVAPPGYLGDPLRGRALVSSYGCTACHVIPSAPTRGLAGPSLERIGARPYIAGHFPNTQIDMIEWLRFPRERKPGTLMPDLGVSERDARDLAAYLATLR